MSLLHQLDIWAYQLVVSVWRAYWPSLVIVFVLAGLERRFPIEPRQPFRPWFFNLAWHAFFLAFAVLFTWGAWGGFIAWLTSATGRPLLRLGPPEGPLGEFARLLLAMFVFDFFSYWWHRLQHANPVLWVMHQFHHDERHMNASTSFRTQWINLPFNQIVIQVPLVWLLGYEATSPAVFLALGLMVAFSHSNLRVDLGPLTRVVVGPAYHRIHHDRERRLCDSNYASIFPFWDLLFGTARLPAKGEPLRTLGVEGVETTRSLVRACIQPVADWLGMLRRRDMRL
jgi:sterol desaturase/sphingolipid hydroxylase (fatty acid hydroxylase superfamily)